MQHETQVKNLDKPVCGENNKSFSLRTAPWLAIDQKNGKILLVNAWKGPQLLQIQA